MGISLAPPDSSSGWLIGGREARDGDRGCGTPDSSAGPPCFWCGDTRGGPAVGVHGLRSVIGSHIASLGREGSVRGRQVLLIGRLGQSHTQEAAASDGQSEISLLATPVGVMLVGHETFGTLAGSLTVVPTRVLRPSRSTCRSQKDASS